MTLASWEQLAMIARFLPNEGAQATSLTQSEWPSSLPSSVHLKKNQENRTRNNKEWFDSSNFFLCDKDDLTKQRV